jgi:hypothetical protein
MMRHLQEAFAFDIRMRRDVDESFSRDGIKVVAHDIREGKVYERRRTLHQNRRVAVANIGLGGCSSPARRG